MLRADLDAGEAQFARSAAGPVEMKLVEALLGEDQPALRAVDFEVQLHLAARRHPVGLDGAAAAPRKTEHHAGDVVDLDLHAFGGTRRLRPRFHDGLDVGRHLGHGTQQETRHADDVRTEVGDHARPAAGIEAPDIGAVRIGHVVLGMDAAEAGDLAQLASGDHLARQLERRVLDVVVANLRLDARCLGRLHHLARLAGAGRQRLFAMNMLAGPGRGDRHLLVQDVGRGHRDDVDCRVVEQTAPVAGRGLEAILRGKAGRRSRIRIRHAAQAHARDVGEHRWRGAIGIGMGPAHESRADQSISDLSHDLSPGQPCNPPPPSRAAAPCGPLPPSSAAAPSSGPARPRPRTSLHSHGLQVS